MSEALTKKDLAAVADGLREHTDGAVEGLRGQIVGVDGSLRKHIAGVADGLREHTDGAVEGLRGQIVGVDGSLRKHIAGVADGLREHITRSTREVIEYVNQSQTAQDERVDARFDRLETKVDAMGEDLSKVKLAVVDLLATDKHVHNLVRELQGQDIALDEKRIFAE